MNKKLLKNLEEKQLFDSEKKLKFLGDGEWVNEPDEVTFEYKGFKCQVWRIFVREPYTKDEHWFGGHLCGYVYIPSDHIYFQKHYNDMSIDCHGGLTYSDFDDTGQYKIGFDCAHLGDYMPSMEYFYKTDAEIIKMREKYDHLINGMENHCLFNPTYKNIIFCIGECCSIVDQLIEVKNHERK